MSARTRRPPTQPRGQATVELGLGITVFITVLMLGIHLAEVGVISLKVTEAANYALFEGTGERIHHFDPGTADDPNSAYSTDNDYDTRMENAANQRYVDFDGRSGTNGGNTIQMAVTQGGALTVNCDQNAPVAFAIPAAPGNADSDYDATRNELNRFFQDRGQAECRATALVASLRIPQQYWETGRGGTMTAPHWKVTPWRLCGAGRAVGGTCTGRFGILLGDWSLDGRIGDRNNETVLYDRVAGDNATYRNMVEKLWEKNGKSHGKAASRFAKELGGMGSSPYDESRYYMSYAGTELGYVDGTTEPAYVVPNYPKETGGVYQGKDRHPCFLGQRCP